MHPIVEQVRTLPISERIAIVQGIWDDIAASDDRLLISPSDLREAERIADECYRNPELTIGKEEFLRRVDRNV